MLRKQESYPVEDSGKHLTQAYCVFTTPFSVSVAKISSIVHTITQAMLFLVGMNLATRSDMATPENGT